MERLLSDDDLVKSIVNKEKAFLAKDIDNEDRDSLPYKNIFPYRFVEGVQKNAESYICMSFEYEKVKGSNYFKYGYVSFLVLCHESLVRTSYGLLRYDFMINRIDTLINNSRGSQWFGKMELHRMSELILNNGDYIGAAITYKNVEPM